MKLKPAAIALLLTLSAPVQAYEILSVPLPECTAKVERRTLEPDLFIVRSQCPLSLTSLTALLDGGLRHWFGGDTSSIRSISLGRLMDYPEWSETLAKTAAQSP